MKIRYIERELRFSDESDIELLFNRDYFYLTSKVTPTIRGLTCTNSGLYNPSTSFSYEGLGIRKEETVVYLVEGKLDED